MMTRLTRICVSLLSLSIHTGASLRLLDVETTSPSQGETADFATEVPQNEDGKITIVIDHVWPAVGEDGVQTQETESPTLVETMAMETMVPTEGNTMVATFAETEDATDDQGVQPLQIEPDLGLDDTPVTCGTRTCESGEYCCNSSCSICAPMGSGCIAAVCVPCGPMTCMPGDVCCNPSCGICTPPRDSCTQEDCGEEANIEKRGGDSFRFLRARAQ